VSQTRDLEQFKRQARAYHPENRFVSNKEKERRAQGWITVSENKREQVGQLLDKVPKGEDSDGFLNKCFLREKCPGNGSPIPLNARKLARYANVDHFVNAVLQYAIEKENSLRPPFLITTQENWLRQIEQYRNKHFQTDFADLLPNILQDFLRSIENCEAEIVIHQVTDSETDTPEAV